MRTTHLAVGGLVVCALALSTLLVPTAAEIGSHLLNDHDGGRARTYLERALGELGPVREIALPLVKIYRDQGEAGAALRLLDRLRQHTGGVDDQLAHSLRRRALRDAGRDFEAADALRLGGLREQPDDVVEELAALYGNHGLVELQLEAMQELLRRAPNSVELPRTVAHLLAVTGRVHQAMATLDALWQRDPTAFTAGDVALWLDLHVRFDPTDRAARWARRHLRHFPAAGTEVDVAQRLLAAGRAEDARAFVQPSVDGGRADLDTLHVWAQAMLALDRVEPAAATLRTLIAQGEDVGPVTTLLCRVALASGRRALALELALKADLGSIQRDVLIWLASTALAEGQDDALKAFVEQIDLREQRDDAATIARLAWEAGRPEIARRWLTRARAAGATTVAERRNLVELALAMRDRDAAIEQLGAWTAALDPRTEDLLGLATLWWRAGAPQLGQRQLDRALDRAQDRGVTGVSARSRAATALLLAAAGHAEAALQRCGGPGFTEALRSELRTAIALAGTDLAGAAQADGEGPNSRLRAWLRAMASIGVDQGQEALARWAWRELRKEAPTDRAIAVALAQSNLGQDDPEAALDALRGIAPLRGPELDLQRTLLLAAWRKTKRHRDELVRAAVAYVSERSLRDPEVQSWVHLLLELRANVEALPFVTRLATTLGGGWVDRRVALLDALGDRKALAELWRGRGTDAQLPIAERLAAADRLRDLGDRAGTLDLLRAAAEGAEPDSDPVRKLLNAWGPRPGPAATAWLRHRAEATQGATRVAWARHLLWVGAASDVVRLLDGDSSDEATLALRVEAQIAAGQVQALAAWTLRRVASLGDAALVRKLAQVCTGHRQPRAAEAAWSRLLELQPRDATALRTLAQASAAQPARAERYWQALLALPPAERGPTTWRDHVALADALRALPGRGAEVNVQLAIALRLRDASDEAPGQRDRDAGRLLARMGRPRDAALRLAKALSAAECDDGLRADLVAALMAAGELERANALVDPPPSCRAAAPQPESSP